MAAKQKDWFLDTGLAPVAHRLPIAQLLVPVAATALVSTYIWCKVYA